MLLEDANNIEISPMPHIVLCGKMRAGKDFIADQLETVGYTRVSFADGVKNDVARGSNVTREYLDANKPEFREKLQQHGQGMRGMDSNYWIKQANKTIRETPGCCVITDCRYPNEAAMTMKSLDAFVLKVNTDLHTRLMRIRETEGSIPAGLLTHPSETKQDMCKFHMSISGKVPVSLINPTIVGLYRSWVEQGKPICIELPEPLKPRIYIAGPMTLGDVEDNVQRGLDMYYMLMDKGYIPFCPQLSHYAPGPAGGEPISWHQWLVYDEEWVDQCHAVLRLTGDSRGADREEQHAREMGIPVYYSVEELDAEWHPNKVRAKQAEAVVKATNFSLKVLRDELQTAPVSDLAGGLATRK